MFGFCVLDGLDGVPNSGDDDGFVDYVFINTLSTPQGFIIGGTSGVAGLGRKSSGQHLETTDAAANGGRILISPGIISISMSREGTYAQTVGSMAHEFGHAIGLPDLYDMGPLSKLRSNSCGCSRTRSST